MEVDKVKDLLSFRLSGTDSQQLLLPVSLKEIKDVLFGMTSNKSSGPDGFNSELYKSLWEIISAEYIIAVQAFFVNGFHPKGINFTILALIPRKKQQLR